MAIANGVIAENKPSVLSPDSYDVDTPSIETEGGRKAPLRISGVDGTEIGSGKDAEFFRNGLIGIFGGAEVDQTITGQDPFKRNLGNMKVDGVDWKHLLLEVGASENWGKYGFDKSDTVEDERFKWYSGKTQSTNIEAYELLESNIEPSEIISDSEFQRIELLRKSLSTHLGDANEGVLDKPEAQAVARELMADQDKLAAAQKRRWYELARNSNVGSGMLAAWNDSWSRSVIEEGNRSATLDVAPRTDTSYWGIAKNAYEQQFSSKVAGGSLSRVQVAQGGIFGENFTEKHLDNYINDNDIAPDVAATMYDTFETDGFYEAIRGATKTRIGNETVAQASAIDKMPAGAAYVAKLLVNEALPYLVDPTAWVVGAGAGQIAAKATFSKVASPLVSKMMQGATIGSATGLSESMVFTANNYKDFTNEELLKTWSIDAGFGGAFGAVFAAGAHGLQRYGENARAKAMGEGVNDLNIVASPEDIARRNAERATRESGETDGTLAALRERDATWDGELTTKLEAQGKLPEEIDEVLTKVRKARHKTRQEKGQPTYSDDGIIQPSPTVVRSPEEEAAQAFSVEVEAVRTRMGEMQGEIASDLAHSTGKPVSKSLSETAPAIEVEPPVEIPKPTPRLEETPEGTVKVPDEEQPDLRTPEEIEAQEAHWQEQSVASALEHHQEVVKPALQGVNDRHNWVAKLHRALGKSIRMQEFASRMIFNTDPKMSFIGTHLLETGTGFSGKFKRPASAALTKDSLYTRHTGNLNKSYVDSVRGWAMEQGGSKYKSWKAAWEGGKVNTTAKEFHRAVFVHQEALQAGRVPVDNKYIADYVRELNKVNDELFNGRIDANIKGFDKARRISNYLPHVWKKVKVGELVKRFGEEPVLELLVKSIESAKRQGKIADNASTRELAEKQLNWINGLGDSMEHMDTVGDGVSGRGKSRIPLDFTVEHNGLHMADLIDTDIPSLMDSYIQRAAADIGISKATNGLIRSEGDFDKFLTPTNADDKLLAQDAKDMLYGRPTRTGMSPEMRSMMDLVTIQQMGGIGVAQLAETGTMAQRLIVNYVSQPQIAKKLWVAAGADINDKGILHQVRSIAAVNDNIQYINRYSVNNIDQAQVEELSHLRAASIDAVDKLTLGAYKAQFGRMLGSLSGVNAIQRAQSKLLQTSFAVDIARAAKFEKGTSTTARLLDLGLSQDGKAFDSIRTHTEFDADGFPTNFNFEKWDKSSLDEFVHAMNREEAQLMPRVMAGELPVFMNKPLWQAIMQFRKTPLAFMSKGAQRNLQFADREAVLGTVLNALTAGVTRYAKVAAGAGAYVALSDAEFQDPTMDQMQPYNYVSNFGILGDAYSLSKNWSQAYQQKDGIESMWEGAQVVPVLSAVDNAYHAVEGDPASIKRATPLNTLPLINEVTNAVIRNMEQN